MFLIFKAYVFVLDVRIEKKRSAEIGIKLTFNKSLFWIGKQDY